jgi:hypothetical protein
MTVRSFGRLVLTIGAVILFLEWLLSGPRRR